jgi:hypothetical protein
MRYIKNLRSYDALPLADPLTAAQSVNIPADAQATKASFRAWCGEETTDHFFISANEGLAANQRITSDNPIHTAKGLICDYDSAANWDEIEAQITRVCPYPPTYLYRSFSGAVRVVWMFEAAIPIHDELYGTFIKELGHALAVEKVTFGFDAASYRSEQYFEIGRDWRSLGGFLPRGLVNGIVCKASAKTRFTATEVSIPISEVAEEVARQFPDRWKKEFQLGARGPLFWIDDGRNEEACVIREDGVTCYSDRAGKGFLSWGEILGDRFVKDYETKKLAPLLDEYWYDGKSFLKLMNGHTPTAINERQVMRELRQRGFAVKPKKGEALSEVESAILTIQNVNRVDCVAPLLFHRERIVTCNSQRILNSAQVQPTLPADNGDPANWPFLHSWLSQLFVDPDTTLAPSGATALDYFFSWAARIYLAVLGRYPAQGQALLLVGPTGRGKTLLSNCVLGGLLGGFGDASDFLAGKTAFNRKLCGCALWVIDDTVSAASFQDQRRAAELLKRTVANPKVEYHPKYVDSIDLPWTGRAVMGLNMDANSMSVVPSLDSSNRDKIMALRIRDGSTTVFPDNHIVEATVARELPYFARFLADWRIPPAIQGDSRFGVASYIDPLIVSAAFDNGPRASIAEMVDWFVKHVRNDLPNTAFWQGTLTEYQTTIMRYNDGRHLGHSHNVEFVRRGIAAMEESFRQEPGKHRPVLSHGDGGGKVWAISLDAAYDLRGRDFAAQSTALLAHEPFLEPAPGVSEAAADYASA